MSQPIPADIQAKLDKIPDDHSRLRANLQDLLNVFEERVGLPGQVARLLREQIDVACAAQFKLRAICRIARAHSEYEPFKQILYTAGLTPQADPLLVALEAITDPDGQLCGVAPGPEREALQEAYDAARRHIFDMPVFDHLPATSESVVKPQ